ncbi:MAG: hypothetical protein IKD69_06935 [Solobacterium sp.]|nr:hypothetical protein [Solobacterium sp.]
MKRFSSRTKQGMISAYFFAVTLYILSFCTVMLVNERRKAAAFANLVTAKEAFAEEAIVISSIRCSLLQQEEVSGGAVYGISWQAETQGQMIYVQIHGTYEASMEIVYDPESGEIQDYVSIREVELTE